MKNIASVILYGLALIGIYQVVYWIRIAILPEVQLSALGVLALLFVVVTLFNGVILGMDRLAKPFDLKNMRRNALLAPMLYQSNILNGIGMALTSMWLLVQQPEMNFLSLVGVIGVAASGVILFANWYLIAPWAAIFNRR